MLYLLNNPLKRYIEKIDKNIYEIIELDRFGIGKFIGFKKVVDENGKWIFKSKCSSKVYSC